MYPSRILSSNLKSTQNQIRSGKNLFIFHRQTTNPHLITLAQYVLCIFSHVSCCQDVESQVDQSDHLWILLFLWIIIRGYLYLACGWAQYLALHGGGQSLFCTCPSNILMLDTLHDNHRCCHITQTPELISWSANVLSLYGLPLYLHIVYMNLYNYTKYVHTSPSKCRESQSRK